MLGIGPSESAGPQAVDLLLRAAGGDDDRVELGFTAGLEQQRNVGDRDGAGPRAALLILSQRLEPSPNRAIDRRMNDRFEAAAGNGILEHDSAERRAVE